MLALSIKENVYNNFGFFFAVVHINLNFIRLTVALIVGSRNANKTNMIHNILAMGPLLGILNNFVFLYNVL